MSVEKKHILWSKWVVANGLGIILGTAGATVLIPLIAILLAAFGPPDKAALNIFFVLAVAAGAFIGATLGLSQWLVLRSMAPQLRAWAWICATAGGAFLVGSLILLPEVRTAGHSISHPQFAMTQLLGMALFLGALFGAIIGTAQWVVLRTYFAHAAWWILSTATAGAIGLPFVVIALTRAETQASYGGFWLVGTLGGTAAGIVCAGITGLGLLSLRASESALHRV